MAPTVAEILAPFTRPSPSIGGAKASVVVVLRAGSADAEALLIERTVREEDPASGQVALPGGHVEPTDADLEAAALRELEEEVGLGRADLAPPVRYVATLEARRFRMDVGVFAAELAPTGARPVRGSPREVADVFWLPLGRLASSRTILREGPSGPIEVPAVRHDGHVVWGFTLKVLQGVVAPARLGYRDGLGVSEGLGGVQGASTQPS